ncbi:MAG: translation initiation factor IF-6 [Euryarchaeota archaeon]|nr:translation initiation factor IF-6 [Euryarchaeota archaeon]
MIRRMNLNGNPNLGVSISTTDEIAIVPTHISEPIITSIKEVLDVSVVKTPIAGCSLTGALSVGNSNGFIVSRYALDSEIERIREHGVNVERIPDKLSAVGNIILTNNSGALVNPLLSDESLEVVKNVLDLEVVRGSIAGFKIIGSVAAATEKGVLAHPSTQPDELDFIESVLKIPADIGTINNGVPLVGACTAANSKGVLVGLNTTGPELARVEEALGFLEG